MDNFSGINSGDISRLAEELVKDGADRQMSEDQNAINAEKNAQQKDKEARNKAANTQLELEKAQKQKRTLKKVLNKVLSKTLDKKRIGNQLQEKLSEEDQTSSQLLHALQGFKEDKLDAKGYRNLVASLRKMGLRSSAAIIKGESQKVKVDGEKLDTKFLMKIARKGDTQVDTLARLSMASLEQRMLTMGSDLREVEELRKKENNGEVLGNDDKLFIQAVEYEERTISRAIIKRHFDNIRLIGDIDTSTPNGLLNGLVKAEEDAKGENKKRLTSLISEYKLISQQIIDPTADPSDKKYSDQELVQRLDRLRVSLEENFRNTEIEEAIDERLEELLGKRTGYDKQKQVREIISMLPKTRIAELMEAADRFATTEDSSSLDQFIQEILSSSKYKEILLGDAANGRSVANAYTKNLIERAENLTEEDYETKLEIFALASSKRLKLEMENMRAQIEELKNSDDESKKKFIRQIPQDRRERLVQMLAELQDKPKEDYSEDVNLFEAIANENFDKITQLIDFSKNDLEQDFDDTMLSAEELIMMDFDHHLYAASEEVKAQAVKYSLMHDIVRAGDLNYGMIRARFNLYELPALNIYNKDDLKQLKESVRKRIADSGKSWEESEDVYNSALKDAQDGGPTGLYNWREKELSSLGEIDSDEKRQMKEQIDFIADSLEEELMAPYTYEGPDANKKDIYSMHEQYQKIFREALKFKQVNAAVKATMEKYVDKEKSTEKVEYDDKLYHYVFKNMIITNFLTSYADHPRYDEIKKLAQEKLSSLTAGNNQELLTAIEQVISGIEGEIGLNNSEQPHQIAKITQNIKELFERSQGETPEVDFDWQSMFSIEQGPGGMYVSIGTNEMMRTLLGIDSSITNVQGVTLHKNNLLQLEPGKDFPGQIAFINHQSEHHEKLHIAEAVIENAMNQDTDSKEPNTYRDYGLDEIVANLMAPDPESVFAKLSGLTELGVIAESNEISELATLQEKSIGNINKTLLKDEQKQKAFVILNIVKDVMHGYRDKSDYEKAVAKEIIISTLTEKNTKLDEIIFSLSRQFSDVEIGGLDVSERQQIIAGISKEVDPLGESPGLAKQAFSRNMFALYASGQDDQKREAVRKKLIDSKFYAINGEDSEAFLGTLADDIKINLYTGENYSEQENLSDYVQNFANSQATNRKALKTMQFMRIDSKKPQHQSSQPLVVTDNAGNEKIIAFRQPYTGDVAQRPQIETTSPFPDTLPEKVAWQSYYNEYGREFRTNKMTMMDTIYRTGKSPSAFEEKAPLRFIHLPGAQKNIVMGAAEAMINGGVDKVMRTFYPMNTRDFQNAWGGTRFGNYLGVSKFRGSSPASRVGYMSPFAKAHEQWFMENRSGLNAKGKIAGHVYPDYMRNLTVDDRYFTGLNTIQQVVGDFAGGSQAIPLLEKVPLVSINSTGGRPELSRELNQVEAGKISDQELYRFQAEALNFGARIEDQVGFNNYQQQFSLGLDSTDPAWKAAIVVLDDNHNLKIRVQHGDNEPEYYPLSEDVIRRHMPGADKELRDNSTYYNNWQPSVVFYNGSNEYYVHYNPYTGEPGLYESDYIDWTNPPPPLKDDLGNVIYPDHCRYKNLTDYANNRNRMDQNIAVIGLFNQMMKLREKQKAYLEEKERAGGGGWDERSLYSFQDLIRSVMSYQDPFGGPTLPGYVEKKKVDRYQGNDYTEKFERKIQLPNPDGSTFMEVDYSIAEELVNRLLKFSVRDNIIRQAYIKGQPEMYAQAEQIPMLTKFRGMVHEYVKMLVDPRMEFYNRQIVVGAPRNENEVQKISYDELNAMPKDQFIQRIRDDANSYFSTPEGAAVKLRILKEKLTIQEQDEGEYSADYANAQADVRFFADFHDYEKILYDGQYGLFKNKETTRRRENRMRIMNSLRTVLSSDRLTPEMRTRILNSERSGAASYNDPYGNQDFMGLIIDKVFDMDIKKQATRESQLNTIIFQNEGENPIVLRDLFDNEADAIALLEDLNVATEELYNIGDFDKRPIERLMADKTEEQVYQFSNQLMSNMMDRDKYRHQMKQYTLKMNEIAELFSNEYNRYRRSKYLWETLTKQIKRLNTISFFVAAGGMLLVANPAFFTLLLANIGVAKTFIPYFDMKTAVAVNRRNYAQELRRKTRQEALRVLEMYEKGMTMNEPLKKDLDDIVLDFNILGETIQGKFKPEGWKPGSNFAIDTIVNSLLDQQGGLIPKALAA